MRITPARPYVEVGEYQLSYFQEAERDEVHEETRQRGDWHVIKRSEFANIVRAGMELEMSIIIRKAWESWRPLARKCPLCQYQNRGITSEPWITWYAVYLSKRREHVLITALRVTVSVVIHNFELVRKKTKMTTKRLFHLKRK